jgi:hypothetical protein
MKRPCAPAIAPLTSTAGGTILVRGGTRTATREMGIEHEEDGQMASTIAYGESRFAPAALVVRPRAAWVFTRLVAPSGSHSDGRCVPISERVCLTSQRKR